MKKAFTIMLILSLVLIVNAGIASAQGPSGSYVSGVSCVDLSDNGANINMEVFASADDGGASKGSFIDTINPGSNIQYFTGTTGDKIGDRLGTGNTGSVVVSSDNEIACSINTQTTGGTLRVGTSNGLSNDGIAPKLFVPQALRLLDGTGSCIFCSYVAIQKAGDTGASTVTARFFDATGNEITAASQTFDIPANSSHIFYQDTNTNLPANFNGSATFESDDGSNLAGTVVLFSGGTTLLTYDAFAGGANTVTGPRFVKNISDSTLFSGLACQNLSTGNTDITADFSIVDQGSGSIVNGSVTKTDVGPNQSFLLFAGDFGNAALDAIGKGFGSVTVSASGGAEIACTFNEDSRTAGSSFNGTGSTYNGLPSAAASTTVSFPQVVALGASSFRGGFQYANTTSNDTTCTHTYATTSGVLGTVSGVTLAGNGSNSIFAETEMKNAGGALAGAAESFNGSVTVTCDDPIVGIYNLAALPLGGDSFITNTGVNVQ